jgi:predicted dehydrogenase
MLRAGIIGCGEVAEWFHFPAQHALPFIATVAAADVDRQRAERLAARFGVAAVHSDYVELLDREDLDFVTVCLPPALHRGAVESAAARGVDVFCEKPMAATPADVERIVDAVHASGIKFMVSQNFRWHPDVVVATQALRAGAIGDVFNARVEEFVLEDDQTYRRTQERFVLLEHAVHYIDLLRQIVDDEVRRVHAVTRSVPGQAVAGENLVSISLEFERGALGRVDNCVCTTRGDQVVLRMRVDGTRGTLLMNTPEAPLRIYSETEPQPRWLEPRTTSRLASDLPPEEYPWPMAELRAGVEGAYDAFFRYVRGGEQPPTAAIENAKTMALVFAAYESAEESRVVEIG